MQEHKPFAPVAAIRIEALNEVVPCAREIMVLKEKIFSWSRQHNLQLVIVQINSKGPIGIVTS